MWAPTQQTNYLMHFGVKGMRWGIRRYQNPDGTLTAEGRRNVKSYGTSREMAKSVKQKGTKLNDEGNKLIKKSGTLSRDFGGKHENVDDPEYFEYEARGRNLNTDEYWNAYKEYKKAKGELTNFKSINRKSIALGEKIVREFQRDTISSLNNKASEEWDKKYEKALEYNYKNKLDINFEDIVTKSDRDRYLNRLKREKASKEHVSKVKSCFDMINKADEDFDNDIEKVLDDAIQKLSKKD